MNAIDWLGLLRNSFSIVGLSITLATLSYAGWWAELRNIRLSAAMRTPRFSIALMIGMLLFCVGQAWGAVFWWMSLLWIVLGLLLARQLNIVRRDPR